jgi:hypothetical protein
MELEGEETLKKMNEVLKAVDLDEVKIATVPRKARTDEELKQIAQDAYAGKIFTCQQAEPEMWKMIFMPLGLMSDEQLVEFANSDPGLFFEYLDKAGPRSVNSYPIFFSFQTLSQEEAKKVRELLKKIGEAMNNVKLNEQEYSDACSKSPDDI